MRDASDLRALAEAASPGPWSSDGSPYVCGPDGDAFVDVHWNPGRDNDDLADAAYIAAASPDVILALLDVAEAVRESIETCAYHPGAFFAPDGERCDHSGALRAALDELDKRRG